MTDKPDNAAAERIAQLRSNIDEIDAQLVELLNRRAECSLEIRKLKPTVHWGLYDPAREEEIFTNLAKKNRGPLYADNLREIYSTILHVMKEMQG
ncbi:MAG: chorismate mutase [Coriobacteriia bacterium]